MNLKCDSDGKDFIMHGVFVDDIKHVPKAKYLVDEFLEKYSRFFEITGGHHLIKSFIGLDVEQSKSQISFHLYAYNRKTLDIYQGQRRLSVQSLRRFSRDMYLHQQMYQKYQKRSHKHSIIRW